MPGKRRSTAPRIPPAAEVLAELRLRAPGPGLILPDYDGLSVCRLADLVYRNFRLPDACPEPLAGLLDRPYRRVVLFILDALGWHQLHSWRGKLPALDTVYGEARVLPLTVPFPSTTTVALTSIYTGLTPAEHGISGHNVYLREVGAVADILRFSPLGDSRREVLAERGWDIRQLFPVRTLFQALADQGLQAISITRSAFMHTALSRLHHVGAEVRGYLTGADMFVQVRRTLAERFREGLLCVYWDVVDMLAHEYGAFSEEVRGAVNQFFYLLREEVLAPAAAAGDTLVLLTADHGQTDTRPEEAVFLSEQRRLLDLLLLPPTGQSRAVYLHANQGEFLTLGEALGGFADRLWIRSSEEALRSGLFGPPAEARRIRHRVGDYLAISRGGSQFLGVEVLRDQLAPRGRHGGLSEQEMLVPLIALTL